MFLSETQEVEGGEMKCKSCGHGYSAMKYMSCPNCKGDGKKDGKGEVEQTLDDSIGVAAYISGDLRDNESAVAWVKRKLKRIQELESALHTANGLRIAAVEHVKGLEAEVERLHHAQKQASALIDSAKEAVGVIQPECERIEAERDALRAALEQIVESNGLAAVTMARKALAAGGGAA